MIATDSLKTRKAEGEGRLNALRASLVALKRRKTVLVVDDEEAVRLTLGELLKTFDCAVTEAENGLQAINILKEKDFDLILLDIRMPILNGVEVLKEVRSFKPDARFVIITGYDDAVLIQEAYSLGAITVMLKPVTLEDLQGLFNQVRT